MASFRPLPEALRSLAFARHPTANDSGNLSVPPAREIPIAASLPSQVQSLRESIQFERKFSLNTHCPQPFPCNRPHVGLSEVSIRVLQPLQNRRLVNCTAT